MFDAPFVFGNVAMNVELRLRKLEREHRILKAVSVGLVLLVCLLGADYSIQGVVRAKAFFLYDDAGATCGLWTVKDGAATLMLMDKDFDPKTEIGGRVKITAGASSTGNAVGSIDVNGYDMKTKTNTSARIASGVGTSTIELRTGDKDNVYLHSEKGKSFVGVRQNGQIMWKEPK